MRRQHLVAGPSASGNAADLALARFGDPQELERVALQVGEGAAERVGVLCGERFEGTDDGRRIAMTDELGGGQRAEALGLDGVTMIERLGLQARIVEPVVRTQVEHPHQRAEMRKRDRRSALADVRGGLWRHAQRLGEVAPLQLSRIEQVHDLLMDGRHVVFRIAQAFPPGRVRDRAETPMSTFETTLLRLLLAMGILAVGGCISNREQAPTLWPPDDFRLEVELGRYGSEGYQIQQRAQFWNDGLAVYQEADRSLRKEGVPLALPIFERLCSYRLRPESIRSLSREIGGLDIAALPADQGAGGSDGYPFEVHVAWAAFGSEKDLHARGRVRLPMAQLLRIVNAYLPAGRGFEVPRMGGEPRDARIEQVPDVVEGLETVADGYEVIVPLRSEDRSLLMAAIAVAHVAGRGERLREYLARIDDQLGGAEGTPFPESGLRPVAELVRALLQ